MFGAPSIPTTRPHLIAHMQSRIVQFRNRGRKHFFRPDSQNVSSPSQSANTCHVEATYPGILPKPVSFLCKSRRNREPHGPSTPRLYWFPSQAWTTPEEPVTVLARRSQRGTNS